MQVGHGILHDGILLVATCSPRFLLSFARHFFPLKNSPALHESSNLRTPAYLSLAIGRSTHLPQAGCTQVLTCCFCLSFFFLVGSAAPPPIPNAPNACLLLVGLKHPGGARALPDGERSS